jgi:hypothetical protein
MIAKQFKFVNNNLMFIIKLLLTNFIEKKTHRHIAKSTGMNAIILLFLRERTNGYTESQIIPNTSKKASNSGISLRNIRDNFLVIYTVSFPKSLA